MIRAALAALLAFAPFHAGAESLKDTTPNIMVTGEAAQDAAPDRAVWGTDWPHPMWHKPMMNDADEVELLYRYVDYDADMIRRVLVDNPKRLYGFA